MNLVRRAAQMIAPPRRQAMGTFPFDAAGKGRRAYGWNPSYLGINTLLFSHGLELLTRNRDAVRNSAWATIQRSQLASTSRAHSTFRSG